MLFYTYADVDWDEETNEPILTCKYDECKRVKGIKIDRRTTNDPKKVPAYHGKEDWWFEAGRNHRVIDGMIERDFDEEFFIIEINTLQDLLNFQDKYKVNASVSRCKSGYVYNGEELGMFHVDYIME